MKDIPEPPARPLLSNLSEAQRSLALERFRILKPFFEEQIPLPQVAHGAGISLRTARYWARRYQREGLVGLARKIRRDRDQRKLSPTLQQFIEGLALQKPRPSMATIHRKVAETATNRGERVPSYTVVYRLIRKLDPALLTLAHEGTNSYSDRFDLVHRREADAPNAIWQADHTQLDIFFCTFRELPDDAGAEYQPGRFSSESAHAP